MKESTGYILDTCEALLEQPDLPPSTENRNRVIRARYAAGESQAQLARDFGISPQRVYQIIYSKLH